MNNWKVGAGYWMILHSHPVADSTDEVLGSGSIGQNDTAPPSTQYPTSFINTPIGTKNQLPLAPKMKEEVKEILEEIVSNLRSVK